MALDQFLKMTLKCVRLLHHFEVVAVTS